MNKNIKTEFKIDKFVDYAGVEREFILAAVSVPLPFSIDLVIPDYENCLKCNGYFTYNNDIMIPAEKYLLIGISVRNAEDKYDEEIGKRIAVGKALKFKGKQLIVSHAGLVNTKMVQALLEQEAEYFKRDPQSYIAGYRNAEKRWKEKRGQLLGA